MIETPAGRFPRAVPPADPPAGFRGPGGEGTPITGRWSTAGVWQPLSASGRTPAPRGSGHLLPVPPASPAVAAGGTGRQPAPPLRWTRRGRRLLRAIRTALFWLLVLAAAYVIGMLAAVLWLLYA